MAGRKPQLFSFYDSKINVYNSSIPYSTQLWYFLGLESPSLPILDLCLQLFKNQRYQPDINVRNWAHDFSVKLSSCICSPTDSNFYLCMTNPALWDEKLVNLCCLLRLAPQSFTPWVFTYHCGHNITLCPSLIPKLITLVRIYISLHQVCRYCFFLQ